MRRERPRAGRRQLPWAEGVIQWGADVRQGSRSLAGAPLASVVVLVTLALGIGLNTAVFSVVSSVLLAPLPYASPERLVSIEALWNENGVTRARHPGGHFATLRDEATTLDDVAAVCSIRQNLTGIEPPAQVQVGWASRNLFGLLGVAPALGPGLTEDAPPGTAMLSHHLWQRELGSDPDVVGRVVHLDGHPYTIAGVLPEGFRLYLPRFPERVDIWKVPDDWWQNGDVWSEDGVNFSLLGLVARLDDGVTVEQAGHELDGFAERFRREQIDFARLELAYDVTPLRDSVVGSSRAYVLLLFGAVGLVLLVACANVMNLMLARAQARADEIALRVALGSSRSRLVRLLFTESVLLAGLGALGGVALGSFCLRAFRLIQPNDVARLDTVTMDVNVLGFALMISMLSTIVFGLAPALSAAGRRVSGHFSGTRSTTHRSRRRLSHALVVAELSLYLTRFVSSLLFDVDPWDARTFVTIAVVLAVVGLVATGAPARRATKLDPLSVLRAE